MVQASSGGGAARAGVLSCVLLCLVATPEAAGMPLAATGANKGKQRMASRRAPQPPLPTGRSVVDVVAWRGLAVLGAFGA